MHSGRFPSLQSKLSSKESYSYVNDQDVLSFPFLSDLMITHYMIISNIKFGESYPYRDGYFDFGNNRSGNIKDSHKLWIFINHHISNPMSPEACSDYSTSYILKLFSQNVNQWDMWSNRQLKLSRYILLPVFCCILLLYFLSFLCTTTVLWFIYATASSPEPEDELVKEAALYRHSKTSLDGLKSKASFKKSKQTRSKIDTTPAGTLKL